MTDAQLAAYLATFTHTEAGDVQRKKFVLYAKKGEGDFEAIGYKQESAAIANNYDTQDITDVLGNKYTEINAKNETVSMSEYRINKDHSAFLDEAFSLTLAGLEDKLKDYTLLFVCAWLVDGSGNMLARQVENCSLTLDNMGGQAYTMSDVTFSGIGQGVFGTVSSLESPTFTPGTAPSQ